MDTEGKGLGSWEGSRDRGSWVFKAEWKCGPERPPICPWRQVILAWGKEIASQIRNLRAALAVLAYATWPGCPSEDTHKKKTWSWLGRPSWTHSPTLTSKRSGRGEAKSRTPKHSAMRCSQDQASLFHLLLIFKFQVLLSAIGH